MIAPRYLRLVNHTRAQLLLGRVNVGTYIMWTRNMLRFCIHGSASLDIREHSCIHSGNDRCQSSSFCAYDCTVPGLGVLSPYTSLKMSAVRK